jgi:hypothetical protein
MSDLQKVIIGWFFILCAIPGGWIGYQHSLATGMGGVLVGALSGGFVGLGLVALIAPKTHVSYFRDKPENEWTIIMSPFGGVIGVVLLIVTGRTLGFLEDDQIWKQFILAAIAVGALGMVRLFIFYRTAGITNRDDGP